MAISSISRAYGGLTAILYRTPVTATEPRLPERLALASQVRRVAPGRGRSRKGATPAKKPPRKCKELSLMPYEGGFVSDRSSTLLVGGFSLTDAMVNGGLRPSRRGEVAAGR